MTIFYYVWNLLTAARSGKWIFFNIHTNWLISIYTDLFLYAEHQWICKVSLFITCGGHEMLSSMGFEKSVTPWPVVDRQTIEPLSCATFLT